MYITYDEYLDLGGTLDETAFDDIAYDAQCIIDWWTFNRLQNETAYPTAVKRCMYKLIQLLYSQQTIIDVAVPHTTTNETTVTAAISSESNDGVSTTYNTISVKDVLDVTQKEFEDIVHSINKDNNIHLKNRNENNEKDIENDDKLNNQKLSKNQIKKQRKQEEWEKRIYEIKKYKKQKKKEKKRIKREQKEEQEKLNPKNENIVNSTNIANIKDIPFKTRKEIKEEFKQKCRTGVRVIIDCDFEHLMNDASNKSMVRQIIYLYCVNKRSRNPFRLILYGVGKKILEGLKISDYNNWIGIEVYLKEDFPSFEEFIQKILYKDDKRQ